MSQWRTAVADNPRAPDNRSTVVECHLSRSSEPVRAKAKHMRSHSRCRVGKTIDPQLRNIRRPRRSPNRSPAEYPQYRRPMPYVLSLAKYNPSPQRSPLQEALRRGP